MSNRTYKFSKKNWLVVAVSVLLAVIATACTFNVTNSFTEFNPSKVVFAQNEDNLFFEKIEDGEIYDNVQIDCIVKNGEFTLDGSIANTNPGTITMSDSISVATLTLKPGTYTLSCFNKPNFKSYYLVGTYVIGDNTYTWYADFEDAPNNTEKSKLLHGQTVEFTEETTVHFEIRLVEGTELNNVKARPVLVEGDKEGNFFKIGVFG